LYAERLKLRSSPVVDGFSLASRSSCCGKPAVDPAVIAEDNTQFSVFVNKNLIVRNSMNRWVGPAELRHRLHFCQSGPNPDRDFLRFSLDALEALR